MELENVLTNSKRRSSRLFHIKETTKKLQKISFHMHFKIIDLFHTFHKRENNSPVLSFSRIPKSKMMSHSCL